MQTRQGIGNEIGVARNVVNVKVKWSQAKSPPYHLGSIGLVHPEHVLVVDFDREFVPQKYRFPVQDTCHQGKCFLLVSAPSPLRSGERFAPKRHRDLPSFNYLK